MVSITDELREYAQIAFDKGSAGRARIETIADRIDAAHRSALEKLAAQLDESEDGWVRLPVDADGVPIHIGDVMEVKFDTKRRPFTVSFVGERAVAFWVVGQPNLKSFNLDTVLVTHHHEPTVEDVLADIADKAANLTGSYHEGGMDGDEYMNSMQALVAEYAAKLQLREDA